MSQLAPHPDRTMGPICRAMVEAGHIGYPCTLPQDHKGVPSEDPEPCYAMEATSSVRRWQAWRIRRDEATKNASAEAPDEVRVTTGEITATLRAKRCEQGPEVHDQHLWEPEGEEETFFCDGIGTDPQSPTLIAPDETLGLFIAPSWDDPISIAVPAAERAEHDKKIHEALAAATPQGAGSSAEFAECGPSCRVSGEHTPADPKCVMSPPMPDEPAAKKTTARKRAAKKAAAPTKTREGDQALPKGGIECVQDVIIEAMQESKRVGLERYGSALMTFNGRKGFQDVVEEARDFYVYAKQIEMEGQANREVLTEVVAKAIRDRRDSRLELGAIDTELGFDTSYAAVAVDAIMGWVTARTAGGSGGGA